MRFEARAKELLLGGQNAELISYQKLGRDAELSIPTPEHYLPLLYVLGAGIEGDPVRIPVEGIMAGSISMLAVQVG